MYHFNATQRNATQRNATPQTRDGPLPTIRSADNNRTTLAHPEECHLVTHLITLVDFYNAAPQIRNEVDVRRGLIGIRDCMARVLSADRPEVDDVTLRLYGGWNGTAEQGSTLHANWVMRNAEVIRGLRNGITWRPQIVRALAARSDTEIVATLRQRKGGRVQKIVDTMLTADAVYIAHQGYHEVCIWSDDDDMLAAAVTVAQQQPRPMIWIRKRELGRGQNDPLLPTNISVKSVQID